MPKTRTKKEKKADFFAKLLNLLDEYPKILICDADFVGSSHMQQIRLSLRGDAVILMGKNTMIRKAIRGHCKKNPALEALLPHIKLNVGFIFTKGDLSELAQKIVEQTVGAPAKAGAVAPCDVIIPAGDTGMEPTQTSFLQALNIASKIQKGQIAIINDVHLIHEGDKVSASEAALLAKLKIKPFAYGLKVKTVYDNGSVYSASVLNITDEELLEKFSEGIANVASFSLATGYPCAPAVPHVIINGYKNLINVGVAAGYECNATKKILEYLENPEAFASLAPVAAETEEKKEEAAAEEDDESSDDDMGFGLFD